MRFRCSKKSAQSRRTVKCAWCWPQASLCRTSWREGIHPETPPVPFTPGWDLVGEVDRLGGVSGIETGQIVAVPISGGYAELVCLPQRELVPVPSGLDLAEAVSLVLNYITAYQMLHRSAQTRPARWIHGAAGGVGTALLQLGGLAGLEMYGTCSSKGAQTVSDLGGIPLITRIRTWKRFTASRAQESMSSLTASVAATSGALAELSVLAGQSWPMASPARCVEAVWLQVVQGVAIAFVQSRFSRSTSQAAGCSLAANAWFPTASKRSNG